MATLFIGALVLQIIFWFIVTSQLILGKPLHDVLFKHVGHIKHFFAMLNKIYSIAPAKTRVRLAVAFLVSCLPLLFLHDLDRVGSTEYQVFSRSWFYIIYGGAAVLGVIASIIVFIIPLTKEDEKYDWDYLREKAHKDLYGVYDKYAHLEKSK